MDVSKMKLKQFNESLYCQLLDEVTHQMFNTCVAYSPIKNTWVTYNPTDGPLNTPDAHPVFLWLANPQMLIAVIDLGSSMIKRWEKKHGKI